MDSNFKAFTALVERCVANTWRGYIVEDDIYGTLFHRKDMGDEWEITFSVCREEDGGIRNWYPAKITTEPIDMSLPEWKIPDEDEDYVAPNNRAMALSMELLEKLRTRERLSEKRPEAE